MAGAFHCLVQFSATFDPPEMTSLLVCGFPGERSEFIEGYRSFGVFGVLIHCEPRGILFPIFRPEARPSQGYKNVVTLNFYPQVRVDHFSSPRWLRPLFVASPTEKFELNRVVCIADDGFFHCGKSAINPGPGELKPHPGDNARDRLCGYGARYRLQRNSRRRPHGTHVSRHGFDEPPSEPPK